MVDGEFTDLLFSALDDSGTVSKTGACLTELGLGGSGAVSKAGACLIELGLSDSWTVSKTGAGLIELGLSDSWIVSKTGAGLLESGFVARLERECKGSVVLRSGNFRDKSTGMLAPKSCCKCERGWSGANAVAGTDIGR